MLGVFVNSFLVLILGVLGSKLGDRFSKSLKDSIMKFLAVAIIVIGIRSSLSGDIVVIIISLILGIIIGEFLDLEGRIQKFTLFLENKFSKGKNSNFSQAFLSATVLFCVGAMGIIGAIEAGINNNLDILMAKALLDGIVAFFMAQSLGLGVSFSALSLLIYQGTFVILSGYLEPILNKEVMENISGTGGIPIIVIGLSQLKLVDSKLSNVLPSILIPIIYGLIMG